MKSGKKEQRESPAGSDIRKLIAIGASAGGLQPLLGLLSEFPSKSPCSIIIATHLGDTQKTVMCDLLGRRSKMTVVSATNCELAGSVVYVVPPGTHLLVENHHLRLLHSPPIKFLRPNFDLLFRSAAKSFGRNAIGVVLSGMGQDGAEGLRAIKVAGGTTFAEDLATAEFPGMPRAAIDTGSVDWVMSSDTIGKKLVELCMEADSTAEWLTNSR